MDISSPSCPGEPLQNSSNGRGGRGPEHRGPEQQDESDLLGRRSFRSSLFFTLLLHFSWHWRQDDSWETFPLWSGSNLSADTAFWGLFDFLQPAVNHKDRTHKKQLKCYNTRLGSQTVSEDEGRCWLFGRGVKGWCHTIPFYRSWFLPFTFPLNKTSGMIASQTFCQRTSPKSSNEWNPAKRSLSQCPSDRTWISRLFKTFFTQRLQWRFCFLIGWSESRAPEAASHYKPSKDT